MASSVSHRCCLEPSRMNAFKESVDGDGDKEHPRPSPAPQDLCPRELEGKDEAQESCRKAGSKRGRGPLCGIFLKAS